MKIHFLLLSLFVAFILVGCCNSNVDSIKDLKDSIIGFDIVDSEAPAVTKDTTNILVADKINNYDELLTETIVQYADINWERGGIEDNGVEKAYASRIRSDFVEVFPGAKVTIKSDHKDGIVFKLVSFRKNMDGTYRKYDIYENDKYTYGSQNVITISDYCFIRLQLYFVDEPVLSDGEIKSLGDMVKVTISPTLNEYDRELINGVSPEKYTPDENFIIENRDLQNPNTLMFLWASDTHYQVNGTVTYGTSLEKFAEMGQVADALKTDFLIVTGDIVHGYYSKEIQKKNLFEVQAILRRNCYLPVYFLQGNHDDNSWYASAQGSSASEPSGLSEIISNEEFTSYTMSNEIESVVFDEDNPLGGYYYKDFKKAKIRVVILNCEDIPYIENENLTLRYYGLWTMGFQQKQLEWFAKKALRFDEEGWGVVIFIHNDSAMSDNPENVVNIDVIAELLKASKEKSIGMVSRIHPDFELNIEYDYSEYKTPEVIAWFSGHTHKDACELIEGIPHITLTNTCNENGGGYDIVTIDRRKRVIYTKRYNAYHLKEYDRIVLY